MTQRKLLCIGDLSSQDFWRVPRVLIEALQQQLPPWVEIRVVTDGNEFMQLARQAHYIISFPFSANLVRGNRALEWVHFLSSQVPSSWERLRDSVHITDSRGLNADSVVDHGMYLIYRALRREDCHQVEFAVADNPQQKNLGIMGLGAIGTGLLRRTQGLFQQVNVLTRTGSPIEGATSFAVNDLSAFVQNSDYIVLALPLSPQTRDLFTTDFFRHLRPGTTLINLARGELLAEVDLLQQLQSDPEFRYLTDVTHPEPYPQDGPLANQKRVFITPHIGGRRQGIWEPLAARTLDYAQQYVHQNARQSADE